TLRTLHSGRCVACGATGQFVPCRPTLIRPLRRPVVPQPARSTRAGRAVRWTVAVLVVAALAPLLVTGFSRLSDRVVAALAPPGSGGSGKLAGRIAAGTSDASKPAVDASPSASV